MEKQCLSTGKQWGDLTVRVGNGGVEPAGRKAVKLIETY